jgi:CheY-like chemotaxis protein
MASISRRGKPRSVLIVEDDPAIANLIQTLLMVKNYLIINIVDSGESALYAAVTSFPDIILMNIDLFGKIDGITATRLITSMLKLPVIFISAQDDDETFSLAAAAEPASFITKPFAGKDLYSNIEIALHNSDIRKRNKHYNPGPLQRLMRESLSALDAYFIVDPVGRIMYVNPYAEHILGTDRYTPIMVSINRYMSFRDTRSKEVYNNTFKDVIREAALLGVRHNLALIMADGSHRAMSIYAYPIRTSADDHIGYLVRAHKLRTSELKL